MVVQHNGRWDQIKSAQSNKHVCVHVTYNSSLILPAHLLPVNITCFNDSNCKEPVLLLTMYIVSSIHDSKVDITA